MSDEQARALGSRAVACDGWRWMAGMLDLEGFRIVVSEHKGTVTWWHPDEGEDEGQYVPPGEIGADLRDAATLGCLLALVREVWRAPEAVPWCCGSGWWTMKNPCGAGSYLSGKPIDGATEAEALVAALEAAP